MIKKKYPANKVKPKLRKCETVGLFCSSNFYGQYFCLKGKA